MSKRFEIKRVQGQENVLKVYLQEKAQKNKANIDLQKKLESFFNTKVTLEFGEKSKNKKVLLHDLTIKQVEELLEKVDFIEK